MSKSETIVGRIEQALANPEESTLEIMKELASEYLVCCREVNRHLEMAEEQAKSGNSSEAIRQMETFQIMEEYNYVNFAHKDQWKQTCLTLGLDVPITTLDAKADRLIQLYETLGPMRKLLTAHRLLALEHAPLKNRLAILYQIAPMEMLNPVWDEMIHQYEKARLDEIQKEFAQLPKSVESAGALQSILDELCSTNRLTPPPIPFIQRLQEILNGFQNDKMVEYLTLTSEKLTEAYRQMDKEKVKKYLGSYYDVVKRIPADMIPENIRQSIRAPLAWFSEVRKREILEKEFEAKLSVLERSLASDETLEEITAQYSAVAIAAEGGDFSIPESISEAYRSRISMLDTQKRRKVFMIVFVLSLFLVLVGVGIFWATQRMILASRIETESKVMSNLLDQYGFEEDENNNDETDASGKTADPEKKTKSDPESLNKARKYYDNLKRANPKVVEAPALRKQISRLEHFEEMEETRKSLFASERAELVSAISQNKTLPAAVAKMDSLALTESEKLDVIELKKQHSEIETGAQILRDEEFSRQADVVTKIISILEKSPDILSSETAETLQSAKAEQRQLKKVEATGKISPNLVQTGEILANKISSFERNIEQTRQRSEDYQKLNPLIGLEKDYTDELKKLAEKYPDDSQSLNAVIQGFAKYSPIFQWNDFVKKNGNAPKTWENNTSLLKKVIADYEEIKEAASCLPDCQKMAPVMEKLRKLAEAGGRLELAAKLRELYRYYNNDLWVWNSDGRYYYMPENPRDLPNGKSPMYKIEKGEKVKSFSDMRIFTSEVYDQIKPVPFGVAAKELYKSLSSEEILVDRQRWTGTIAKLLTAIDPAADDPDFDPIVKTILQQETLRILDNDPLYSEVFTPWLEIIMSEKNFNPTIDWYNPATKNIGEMRNYARRIQDLLNMSSNLKKLLDQVEANAIENETCLLGIYQWCGRLDRSKTEWTVETKPNENISNGSLWIASTMSDASSLTISPIGRVHDGAISLTESFNLFQLGMPVFLRADE